MPKVTDPRLLAQLEVATPQKVTDPELIQKLNSELRADEDAARARKLLEDLPWYKQAAVGAWSSARELALGAKDLATDLTPEEQAELRYANEAKGGWASGGRFATDVAATAVPGVGAAARAGKAALSLFPKARAAFGLTSPVARDVVASAAMEGVRAPGEGEGRINNAVEGALGAVVGAGMGAAGGKVAHGVRTTPEAQVLLKQGVPLTPGQASSGALVPAVEGAMGMAPGTARSTAALQQKAVDATDALTKKQSWEVMMAADETGAGIARAAFDAAKAAAERVFRNHQASLPASGNALQRLARQVPSFPLITNDPVRRALLGQLPTQMAIQQAMAAYLRRGGPSAAALGGAATDEAFFPKN